MRKHANLKSQIPSVRGALQTCWVCNLLRRLETRLKLFFFVNSKLFLPKKSSKLEMYLILPNFLNSMYVRRVTWCACFPVIYIVCAFVALHEFTTVRCYGRDGAKKRGTMNCVRFRSTCPNNWRIIRCLWNTLILGLWNFVQLKCLVFHAWETCFKLKSHFKHTMRTLVEDTSFI